MTKGKIIKKILKITGRVLLGIFIFVWLVVALINTTPVQSFLAARASEFFSSQWNTKVEIRALSITPFINAGIKDIYVEDLNKDTLLYAGYLEANLSEIPTGPHVKVKNVLLENAVCRLIEKDKKFNFQFIIDYFSSDKPKEKKPSSSPFILEVKDLKLKNVNFVLADKDKKTPVQKGLFASNRIVCNDIDMHVKDFYMKGLDISAEFLHLQARERCGIALKEMKGKVKFSEKGLALQKMFIQTDDSELMCDVSMASNSFKSYSSFVDSVYCDVNIHKGSYINLKDACYWNEKIQGANQTVDLTCDISGKISDLVIKSFDLTTKNTHVNTDGIIKGLTDIDNTLFNIHINDITTSVEDFNTWNLGSLLPEMTLPDMLTGLGAVNIMGEFEGKTDNFLSTLAIVTDLGSVDVKASAVTSSGRQTEYTADIVSSRINAGHIIDNTMLGNTSLDVHAEIVGTNPAEMRGALTAKLKNCYFNGNDYNDICVNGTVNGYDINATANIKDEFINLNADCFINYKGKPTARLDADISDLDLHRMNFVSFADTNAVIAAKIKGGIYEFDINNLNCGLDLTDIEVKTSDNKFELDNISLITVNNEDKNVVLVKSDIIDADISGKYTLSSISNDVNYFLNKYIPDFSAVIASADSVAGDKPQKKEPNTKTSKQEVYPEDYIAESDVKFKIDVKDIELIRSLFDLNVYLPEKLGLNGGINKDTLLYCEVNAPAVYYSDMKIEQAEINLQTYGKQIGLDINMNEFALSDSLIFKDIVLQSEIDSADIGLKLQLYQKGDSSTSAQLEFNSVIDSKGLQGSFNNTAFSIQGTKINLNNYHLIGVADKHVSVMNLVLSSAASSIVIDGVVSDNGILKCKFDNVDLSLVNPFISSMGMSVYGTLNKDVILKDILNSFTFTSDLEITELSFNDVYLGQAWLNVNNNVSPDIFNTDIKFLYQTESKDIVPLQVLGTVAPYAEDQQLDLNVNMQNFSLSIIKTFIASFASDVEGSLSCENLTVKGKLSSPDIQGVIHCNNAAMRVNMLNTKYWLNDDISIDNNKISFNDFVLKDAESNKITVNGDVAHNNFTSFDINLNAVADKIKILDTKAGNGEMYYGTAYASANVTLTGDSTMINISGSAKTEPGTSLTVPVTSKESAMENEFITFIDLNAIADSVNKSINKDNQVQSMGYNIDIDLNVNPNAKLYIPMDFTQLTGNLAAAGNGDLKIAMNSDGKFSMIGEVAIDNGTFIFKIMDVMEKKFILQQGGTLTWSGDPAGGVLDVTAIYKTKASLASLLGNSNTKPVDVESIIRLSGVMTNPQPSFDINLPSTDEQTAEQVFMYIDKSSEKAMLEQTASLLLTNQFYYSQGGYQTEALQSGVTSSLMGVAFSQLSGMLTNMVKVVDVGLNYTSGGTGDNLSDQLDVNLSRSYGKWEVEANASFGGTSMTSNTSDGSQIIGDVLLKYKYNNNLSFEAFNHSNANDFTKYNVSPYTQGVRVAYKKEYERVKDIFARKKKQNALP